MSKKMASIVLTYGVALAGLSLLIQRIAPAFAKVTSITGIAGGGLCVLWGVVALWGHKRRAWAVLTTVAVSLVTLSVVVQAWMPPTDATSTSLTGRLVLTLMLLMSVCMVMYLLHGERPPEFYDPGVALRGNASSRDERSPSPGTRHRQ